MITGLGGSAGIAAPSITASLWTIIEKAYSVEYRVTLKGLPPSPKEDVDEQPPTAHLRFGRSTLDQRINANICVSCGKEGGCFEVHHVRKLKDLKGKERWEQVMSYRKRKTMILCNECHVLLHTGKLSKRQKGFWMESRIRLKVLTVREGTRHTRRVNGPYSTIYAGRIYPPVEARPAGTAVKAALCWLTQNALNSTCIRPWKVRETVAVV
jgi:hypothetical protein